MQPAQFNEILTKCNVSVDIYNSYTSLMCVNTMSPDFILFRGLFGSYSSPYSSNQSFSRSRPMQRSSYSSHSSASDLPADSTGGALPKESKSDKKKPSRKSLPSALEARRITELEEVNTEVMSTSSKVSIPQSAASSINESADKPVSQKVEKAAAAAVGKSDGDVLKEGTAKPDEVVSDSQAKSSSQPLPTPPEAAEATELVEATEKTVVPGVAEAVEKTVMPGAAEAIEKTVMPGAAEAAEAPKETVVPEVPKETKVPEATKTPAANEKIEQSVKGGYRTIVVPPICTDSAAFKTSEVGLFRSRSSSR